MLSEAERFQHPIDFVFDAVNTGFHINLSVLSETKRFQKTIDFVFYMVNIVFHINLYLLGDKPFVDV